MLAWSDLLSALALLLVVEGIAPFTNPARMKQALTKLVSIPDSQLRIAGLGSILAGLLLLFIVRV